MNNSKQRLIDNARDLFLARSYTGVGTNEICAAAKINKGTFYHYYKSKSDLAVDVLEIYGKDIQAAFKKVVSSKASPTRKLERIFEIPYTANTLWQQEKGYSQGCLVGNMSLELSNVDSKIRAKINTILEDWGDAITPLINELIKEKLIPQISVSRGVTAVISYLQGLILIAKTTNDPKIIRSLGKASLAMLKGLSSS